METTNSKSQPTSTNRQPPRTNVVCFTHINSHALFNTRADVPAYLMLEQASTLLEATRVLVTNRDSFDLTAEATLTQFALEMAQAMVESCCEQLEVLEIR